MLIFRLRRSSQQYHERGFLRKLQQVWRQKRTKPFESHILLRELAAMIMRYQACPVPKKSNPHNIIRNDYQIISVDLRAVRLP